MKISRRIEKLDHPCVMLHDEDARRLAAEHHLLQHLMKPALAGSEWCTGVYKRPGARLKLHLFFLEFSGFQRAADNGAVAYCYSPRAFTDEAAMMEVEAVLRDHGIDPGQMVSL